MPDTSNRQIFYGWKVVAALLVSLTFTSGLSFYNHAIYLNALATQPAFNVQTASLAVSIFFFSGGISGLWVAKLVRDFDPRICITLGAVISFISLSSLALVTEVWQLYLVYAFFGVGFSAAGLIPATTLVTRWFHRKRAMALSIASTGLSLGGVILTPLCVLLVDSYGFKVAAPLMGVMYLLGVIPVAWLYLLPRPEVIGLQADGDSVIEVEAEVVAEAAIEKSSPSVMVSEQDDDASGVTFKQARQGRFFWGVSFSYIFLMMAQVGGIAHQYGLAREQLSEAETAIAVAILPVASIIGRLVGAWLVAQMSIRTFAIAMMVLQATSLAVLSSGYSVVSLCIGLALFGTSVGNLLMLQPLLIAEAFGVRDFARIFSVCNLLSSWGTAVGPALLGFAYGLRGDFYDLPYMIAAAAGALGVMLFLSGGKIRQ